MKAIIVPDPHLGRSQVLGKPGSGCAINSRLADQQYLLNWILQKAILLKVTVIIITGDLYHDPRPSPILIQFFMAWLKSCEKVGIQVHIIVGNHDIIRTGSNTVSALDIVPAVEMTHATVHKDVTTVNYDGVSFTFLPYRDRRMYDGSSPQEALSLLIKEFDGQLATMPNGNKKVLVGHLTLEGSLYVGDEIDDFLNEIICPLEIFKGYDYVWMGHIHNHQVLSPNAPYIAHIGSMDRSDFGKSEVDNDKFIVSFDKNGFDNLVLPTRPMRQINIDVSSDKDTTDFIINFLHSFDQDKPLKDAIVKIDVQLDGQETPSSDRDKIYKYIYQNLEAHYIYKFSESRTISVLTQNSNQVLFDNNMKVTSAIDAWSDSLTFDNEEEKILVKNFMYSCDEELPIV